MDEKFPANSVDCLTNSSVRPAATQPNAPHGSETVWHRGERAAQERAGVGRRMADIGPRVLREFMPLQHRAFFGHLPFVIVGSLDAQGSPWASVLSGPPGFVRSTDPFGLDVSVLPEAGDPLASNLIEGAPLGILGIELTTRRRNRVNGRVKHLGNFGFSVTVDQSFGNCPQYIHIRDYAGLSPAFASRPRVEIFEGLSEDAAALIAHADTCFVASAALPGSGRADGVDASHRGGLPGFMKVRGEGTIELPDYRGNFFFNTLGNLLTNPRIGLTVIDFDNGDILQATGAAEIIWEGSELAQHPGAQRLCRITPQCGLWLRGGFPLLTRLREISPQAAATPRGEQVVIQRGASSGGARGEFVGAICPNHADCAAEQP
jgi:predicted pyridoxine 5'-phosphate oxidase superfamily flavin-nucleotide-binding protein